MIPLFADFILFECKVVVGLTILSHSISWARGLSARSIKSEELMMASAMP